MVIYGYKHHILLYANLMATKQTDDDTETLEEALERANAQAKAEREAATKAISFPCKACEPADLSTEEAAKQIGMLAPVAAASLEHILRHPADYPSQAVAAAKLVYDRKLGAVPDTVIQNNMQFIVKWED